MGEIIGDVFLRGGGCNKLDSGALFIYWFSSNLKVFLDQRRGGFVKSVFIFFSLFSVANVSLAQSEQADPWMTDGLVILPMTQEISGEQLMGHLIGGNQCAKSSRPSYIRLADDPGGLIIAYQQRFEQARSCGERVVIDGDCLSACTLATGIVPHDRLCVTPRAVLGFHAAWHPTPFGGRAVSPDATRFMMESYPANIRDWIDRHGGLTPNMIFLRGQELVEMLPTCSDTDIAMVHALRRTGLSHRTIHGRHGKYGQRRGHRRHHGRRR
jgi:hypothetical protein